MKNFWKRLKDRVLDTFLNQPLIVSAVVTNVITWLALWGVELSDNTETGIKVGVNGLVALVTWFMVTPNYKLERRGGHSRIRTRRD